MNNTRLQKLLTMNQENPLDTFVLYALGMEYKGLNQWELAEDFFTKCLQLDPNYVAAYYQLALIAVVLSNEPAAINWLNQGLLLLQNSSDIKTKNEFQSFIDELSF
jgi:tetratricopeptide (TPR) repeat protein